MTPSTTDSMEQKFTEHLLLGRASAGDTEMNKEQLQGSRGSCEGNCCILTGDGCYQGVSLRLGKKKSPPASLAAPAPFNSADLTVPPQGHGTQRVNALFVVAGSLFSQTSPIQFPIAKFVQSILLVVFFFYRNHT